MTLNYEELKILSLYACIINIFGIYAASVGQENSTNFEYMTFNGIIIAHILFILISGGLFFVLTKKATKLHIHFSFSRGFTVVAELPKNKPQATTDKVEKIEQSSK